MADYNHAKADAGEQIFDLDEYPVGTEVVTFEIGTHSWWEHGSICRDCRTGKHAVTVYDAIYTLETHKVYLDKNSTKLIKGGTL